MQVLHVAKWKTGTKVIIGLREAPRKDDYSSAIEEGHGKWPRFRAMANRIQRETKGVVGVFTRADITYRMHQSTVELYYS